jgi:hypothetical protein
MKDKLRDLFVEIVDNYNNLSIEERAQVVDELKIILNQLVANSLHSSQLSLTIRFLDVFREAQEFLLQTKRGNNL